MKNKIKILSVAVVAITTLSANAQDYYQTQNLGSNNSYGADHGYGSQQGGGQQGGGQGFYPPQQQNRAVQLRAVYVPAGTPVAARIQSTLSSQFSSVGETFTASLASPVFSGSGEMVAGPGSTLQGQVVNVTPAGRGGKGGSIDLRLTSIVTPDGKRYPLSASVDKRSFSLEASGGRAGHFAKSTAVGAGAGALSGLIGGAISGGKKGKASAIGTGIGGGIGLLGGAVKKGKDFVLNSGTQVPFTLDTPLQVQVAPNRVPPQNDFGGGGYGNNAPHGGYGAPSGQGGGGFQDPGHQYR